MSADDIAAELIPILTKKVDAMATSHNINWAQTADLYRDIARACEGKALEADAKKDRRGV